MKTTEAGLYIHIPFCRSKCPYCDFYSLKTKDSEELKDIYFTALLDELETSRRAEEFTKGIKPIISSVYIGGGTPSFCGRDRIASLIAKAKSCFTFKDNAEITVEVNPDSATEDFFGAISNAGANRVSIGLQSAIDRERRLLGRLSGAEQAKEAVLLAKKSGIENISLDLMIGIPEQTTESLLQSVDFCVSLGVKHISAYILTLEENTPFFRKKDTLALPDEDTVCEMYSAASEELKKNGFNHYEISNFAVSGFESRHNINYWKCGDYLGIGAAAHSFFNGKRFYYPPDINAFIGGTSPVFDCTGGDEDEHVMLALRLSSGLNYSEFEKRFGKSAEKYIKAAQKKELRGFVEFTDSGFALTEKGFLLSNKIISDIIFPD